VIQPLTQPRLGLFESQYRAAIAWINNPLGEAESVWTTASHGLRKAMGRRLAEIGCSVSQIKALSGHVSLRDVEHYTKAANHDLRLRNQLARQIQVKCFSNATALSYTLM
jgi:integrase